MLRMIANGAELHSSNRGAGEIDGVELRALEMHADARGSFTEVFRKSWNLCIEPVQWSTVHSKAGTLRGMHLHRRHDEYICVLSGKAYVGLMDIRPGSPTEGVSALIELCGHKMSCLSFPKGLIHGWYFSADTLHLQSVSEDYGDYGHDDNLGCCWSDPDLRIKWPGTPTLLSERARGFGTVAQLRELMRQG